MTTLYQIKGIHKTTQKDNWENGCHGDCSSFYINETLSAKTLQELIEKFKSFVGSEHVVFFDEEPNRIDIQRTENADGYDPSESEVTDWKAGNCDMYICDYSTYVEQVTSIPADLSEFFPV